MQNDTHPHIKIMMKLNTDISVYLLISGSEEEIFPKNEQGGPFWWIFATFQASGKYWRKDIKLNRALIQSTTAILFCVDHITFISELKCCASYWDKN